jgi:hypothetical protein
MSEKPISPLRQRMIEDIRARDCGCRSIFVDDGSREPARLIDGAA